VAPVITHSDLRGPKGGALDELAHMAAFSTSKLRLVSQRISTPFNSQLSSHDGRMLCCLGYKNTYVQGKYLFQGYASRV